MTYEGVMLLAEEKPKLLKLVVAAREIVEQFGNQFSGSSVVSRAPGIASNLTGLRRRGIVTATGSSKKGHRVFYELVDPAGTARALRDLKLI